MNLNALAARCARRASGFALIESPDCYPAAEPAHLVRTARDLAVRRLPARIALRRPWLQVQTVFCTTRQGLLSVPVYQRGRRYADAFVARP